MWNVGYSSLRYLYLCRTNRDSSAYSAPEKKYPILLFAFIPLIFAIIAILGKPREEAIGWAMCVVLALGVIGLEPYTSRLLDCAFGPVMRLPYSGKLAIVACALILGAVSLATFTRSVVG